MFRVLFLLLLFPAFIVAQNHYQTAKSVTYSFKVVVGQEYLVSASPVDDEDIVIAIGLERAKPMFVVNGKGKGITESYTVQAVTEEIQVSVYSNASGTKHDLSVIGSDQQFPYLRWRKDTNLQLEMTEDNYIAAFKFSWQAETPVESKASAIASQMQTIAAGSAISYTFEVETGIPLDILLVPETNHLDLALIVVNNGVNEQSDNNRGFENIRLTGQGQVEWTQATPVGSTIEIIVSEKSGFGGGFRLALGPLNGKRDPIAPSRWSYLHPSAAALRFTELNSTFPRIDSEKTAVYEILPVRTVDNYKFEASSLDGGLDFSLVVRADPESPPIVIRAGGSSQRSASFSWSYRNDKLVVTDPRNAAEYYFNGFPTRAKMQITVISTEGAGQIRASLLETQTLRELEIPKSVQIPSSIAKTAISASYEEYERIDNDMVLYRFESEKGKTYRVTISPTVYFDAAIADPTGRHFDNPTALELTDKEGTGGTESITIVAKEDFIEFGIIGIRYERGLVKPSNKRIGGEGYFSYYVEETSGNSPELRETIRVQLPNELVSKELGLAYQPKDPFIKVTASKFPPFPSDYDQRIRTVMNFLK